MIIFTDPDKAAEKKLTIFIIEKINEIGTSSQGNEVVFT